MEVSKVLVIDPDPKNLQILKESLESSNFEVITTGNGKEAWDILQVNKPDIIISEVDIPKMSGFQLLENLQKDPLCASIPLVFLTNRRNLEDRIKSLRTGVKDYMIKPLHVKEVIARVQMILRRIDRLKTEESDTNRKIVGRLEEQSVELLLEDYGIEKRSGVLSLYDPFNRSGEIYFRDGSVVNARIGNFRAEKAVYQMLPWNKGHFVMTFKEVNIKDEITVSNLGLLLQGHKRLQEREKLLKELPALDTVFVKTSVFKQILQKKIIGADAIKFISLFDGRRTLSEIIAESIYDELRTLERIIRLYHQSFIKPSGEFEETISFRREPEAVKPLIEVKNKIKPDELDLQPVQKSEVYSEGHPKEIPSVDKSIFLKSDKVPDSHKQKVDEIEITPKSSHQDKSEHQKDEKNKISALNKTDFEKSFSFEQSNVQTTKNETLTNEKEIDAIAESNGQSQIPLNKVSSEINILCDSLLNGSQTSSSRLIVIGGHNKCRQSFISTITNKNFVIKAKENNIDAFELGKIETSGQRKLEIIGISPEMKFLQTLDQVALSIVAYIILVIGDNSTSLKYLGYLANSLKTKYKAPHIVAVYRPANIKKIPLDFIRYSLNLDENDQIIDVDIDDPASVKYLLNQLIPTKSLKMRSLSAPMQQPGHTINI